MFKRIGILSLLAFVACVSGAGDETTESIDSEVSSLQSELNPDGRHGGTAKAARQTSGGGMVYHGGPILRGTTDVYFIWYGNWSGNSATTILTDLVSNIGGSPYFNINTTYYDSLNVRVSNSVHYTGAVNDAYSQGISLTDAKVAAVVNHALPVLGTDLNGVYFVLTSADVNETSGFCTQYCGWHTYDSTSHIKYAFVGNPDRCPASCSMQTAPNNNVGADGMASIVAHELEESITDPLLNAWYDRRQEENADKCAWTFGNTYTTSNGAKANMKLGTRDFLIQQNWVNVGSGYCALKY